MPQQAIGRFAMPRCTIERLNNTYPNIRIEVMHTNVDESSADPLIEPLVPREIAPELGPSDTDTYPRSEKLSLMYLN
jgi:hypothetical protein